MKKAVYKGLTINYVSVESATGILAGSIVDSGMKVITPRGQKVDEINFASSEFSTEWAVDDPV